MRLAFVVDPLEQLKAYKDSSIAMMREAARRGHEVHALQARDMFVASGKVRAATRAAHVARRRPRLVHARAMPRRAVSRTSTWSSCARTRPSTRSTTTRRCSSTASRPNGARVVNSPRALRDWNEKLVDPRVSRSSRRPRSSRATWTTLHAFIDEHRDVVVKKLDGMGGTMIFRVRADDPNRNVIVETITDMGTAR